MTDAESDKIATVRRKDLMALLLDVEGYGLKKLARQIDASLYRTIQRLERIAEGGELDLTEHIPDRSMVLTSNPPQYYCSNRPDCYSHFCDWDGWTE